MASSTRRSPNATLVSAATIDAAATALQQLAEKPKERLSLREAVESLREPIIAALEKGYSYEDITVMLEKQGVTIAASSLKHYLARSNRQQAKGIVRQTRRKRTAVEATSAEPTAVVASEQPAGSHTKTPETPAKAQRKAIANSSKSKETKKETKAVAKTEAAIEAAPKSRSGSSTKKAQTSAAKPRTTRSTASRAKSATSSSSKRRS